MRLALFLLLATTAHAHATSPGSLVERCMRLLGAAPNVEHHATVLRIETSGQDLLQSPHPTVALIADVPLAGGHRLLGVRPLSEKDLNSNKILGPDATANLRQVDVTRAQYEDLMTPSHQLGSIGFRFGYTAPPTLLNYEFAPIPEGSILATRTSYFVVLQRVMDKTARAAGGAPWRHKIAKLPGRPTVGAITRDTIELRQLTDSVFELDGHEISPHDMRVLSAAEVEFLNANTVEILNWDENSVSRLPFLSLGRFNPSN